jgi:hypothetical protein
MHAGSGSLPARAANAAAVRQAPVAKPPLAADPAKTFRGVTKEAGKDAKAIPGPAWLSSCQHRQQQGDVIMCDADSLLAQPSDKVMVYVRDVKLVRRSSNGQGIGLRESLPRLYRIFVLE